MNTLIFACLLASICLAYTSANPVAIPEDAQPQTLHEIDDLQPAETKHYGHGGGHYGYGKGKHGKDDHGKDKYGKDKHGKDKYGKDKHGKDKHGKGGYYGHGGGHYGHGGGYYGHGGGHHG